MSNLDWIFFLGLSIVDSQSLLYSIVLKEPRVCWMKDFFGGCNDKGLPWKVFVCE